MALSREARGQRSFVDVARVQAQRFPDDIAYRMLPDHEGSPAELTYGALHRRALNIAAALQHAGAAARPVVLLFPPGLDYICAFFGCLYAGAIAVPTYPAGRSKNSRTFSRLLGVTRHCQAWAIVTTSAIAAATRNVCDDLQSLRFLCVDEFGTSEEGPIIQAGQAGANDLAFIQYTSGSTGSPKGVMISHGNLIENSALIYRRFAHHDGSRGVIWLPPYHDMGLIGGILQPIYGGFPCTLFSPAAFIQKPERWLRAIHTYGATTSGGPNFAYRQCVEQIDPQRCSDIDLSSWELAFNGAEPVHPETMQAFADKFARLGFRSTSFYPCYGLAEGTLFVTGAGKATPVFCRVNPAALGDNRICLDAHGRTLASSGRVGEDLDVRIVDPDTRKLCPPAAIGEIWVHGLSVAQGYWRDAQATHAVFRASIADEPGDRCYLRTGDLGFIHEAQLYVTGRLKDLLIVRGQNHYPQDIELTAACSHEGLRADCAAVFAVNDGDDKNGDDQKLVLACELEHKFAQEADRIAQAVRKSVSEVHGLHLAEIVFLRTRTLPKTSSGKVQRYLCRRQYLDGQLKKIKRRPAGADAGAANARPWVSDRSPAGAISRFMCTEMARLRGLEAESIDANAPFNHYGLDSVELVQLAGRLEAQFQVKLSPTLLFDYPTPASLSAYLTQAVNAPSHAAAGPVRQSPHAIAVVGMACVMPGAPDLNRFWTMLLEGRCAVDEVPHARWSGADHRHGQAWNHAALIEGVDQFDAAFFGISPREAAAMDPQQRLLLQVSWHALENAGLAPAALAGLGVGVFVGVSGSDYLSLQNRAQVGFDHYTALGNAHSIAANRLSYFYNFKGPSVVVDTACSSSLVAVHQACHSLRQGECHLALAGGVNLLLDPNVSEAFAGARMLSADGLCKSFDDRADGYGRGEGCGVVVLKALEDAQRDGDTVWAVIRGSAVNQDGRSNGITAPNGPAQQAVITKALQDAGVTPEKIAFIEAHGTGTALGDPVEYAALSAVYGRGGHGCIIGSVKTNIGHLEAAAGVAGLIKTALCLKHRRVPPHLHFRNLNRLISEPCFEIPLDAKQLSGSTPSAAISSFGFGGTNAHMVLEAAPDERPAHNRSEAAPPGSELVVFSAHHAQSLAALIKAHAAHAAEHENSLTAIAYSCAARRNHFAYRYATVCEDRAGLRIALQEAGPETIVKTAGSPRLAFLFTGQGSQRTGMGKALYTHSPDFRHAIHQCDSILQPLLGEALTALMFDEQRAPCLAQTRYAQPVLFAYGYALAKTWMSWGLRPGALLGHSLGEWIAACIAGMLPLHDALHLVCKRAALMEETPEGAMAAVGLPAACVYEDLQGGAVDVAAINGPSQTVVSGEAQALHVLLEKYTQRGIRVRRLPGNRAFHSRLMQSVTEPFDRAVAQVVFSAPDLPLVSNVSGGWFDRSQPPTAGYWAGHMRAPVLFEQGLRTLLHDGVTAFLEVGAAPILTQLARDIIIEAQCIAIASQPAQGDEWPFLLNALRSLYLRGFDLDWERVYAGRAERYVPLPNTVFIPQSYWFKSELKSGTATPATVALAPPLLFSEKETCTMPTVETAAMDRVALVQSEICRIVAALLHMEAENIDVNEPFLEMGADSLILFEAVQKIQDRFAVAVAVGQMFEELTTISALSRYIAQHGGATPVESSAVKSSPVRSSMTPRLVESAPVVFAGATDPSPAPSPASNTPPTQAQSLSDISALLHEQLQLMTQQLATISAVKPGQPVPSPAATSISAAVTMPPSWGPYSDNVVTEGVAWFRKPETAVLSGNRTKQEHLADLQREYNAKTVASKAFAQRNRKHLADNRAAAGFRLSTKEMLYPIVGARAEGSRLWDIDGNEYIDFTMGFGAYLFGHNPAFIKDALHQQLEAGYQIGPQSALAEEVANGIVRATGMQRVAFCNSGTEAVMTAVRLARLATGRDKIALFSGSYHGHSDGLLARGRVVDKQLHTVPIAPGTPLHSVAHDVLVLPYGDPSAIDLIKRHAKNLAAVLIEPVQSRHPELQPKAFLETVREITNQSGTLMIFDEVITGFRVALGGAQECFGVKADLATYGKVVGGGMPIGVVAGRAEVMDGIDGGHWRYGDNSYPAHDLIFFAGTFNKHPLTLRAASAVLDKLQVEHASLYGRLNAKTAALALDLNAYFQSRRLPLRIAHFGSLFRFQFQDNLDLLFYHLLNKGFYIWEGRNCFLSTAHSDEDVERFKHAVRESCQALEESGWLHAQPAPAAEKAPDAAVFPVNPAAQRFARLASLGRDGVVAGTIQFALEMRGDMDIARLVRAVRQTVSRHESLHRVFLPGLKELTVKSGLPIAVAEEALSESALPDWLANKSREPLDLHGAMLTVHVCRLHPQHHLLYLRVHHSVCDGWSLSLLLEDVFLGYRGDSPLSGLPAQQSNFGWREPPETHDAAQAGLQQETERYWQDRIADAPWRRHSPWHHNGRMHAATQVSEMPVAVRDRIKSECRRLHCTPYMVLLAAFMQSLHDTLHIEQPVVGVSLAMRSRPGFDKLVGNYVNILPLWCENGRPSLPHVKKQLMAIYRHMHFPYSRLVKESGDHLFSMMHASFNVEPAALPDQVNGWRLAPLTVPVDSAEFPLVMNLTECAAGYRVQLDFQTALVGENQARALGDAFEANVMLCIQSVDVSIYAP